MPPKLSFWGALRAHLCHILQTRGIRRRWILNSASILVLILTIGVILFSCIVRSYCDNTVLSDMESRVQAAAACLNTSGDIQTAAQSFVLSFAGGEQSELQFLDPEGTILCSSNPLTPTGTVPETGDVEAFQESRALSSWKGTSPLTGERIAAVSAPVLQNGELAGILRSVSSLQPVSRQVLTLTTVAVLIAVVVLVLICASNAYFVRSIVGPLANITGIAKRIADGSYGIQVEKKYDDEVGDLADAINDMSIRIKEAESMKSEFISSVSHELRTPLTAITGWAETIMSGEARDEADIRKGMGIIASETRRLSGMVEELLEFSRIEDGRFTLSIEPMDIKAELEDAVYTYHEFLASEGISVRHSDCEEEFAPIPGDPDRLRQVFCNLLDNAAKHGGEGKRIDTAIFPDGADVVIIIRDYGPGIPEADLPNVKYKFFKGSSTKRGSGIGLAVCDEIISRHNGELIIRNADDGFGGCLVEVRLPMGA